MGRRKLITGRPADVSRETFRSLIRHERRRPAPSGEPALIVANQRINGSSSRSSFGFGWAPTMLFTSSPSW